MSEERNGDGYTNSSDQENNALLNNGDEKMKKLKRKRNQVKDLRFEQELAELDGRSKRKERKKK